MKVKKARMEERFNAVYPENFDLQPIHHTSAFEHPVLPILTSQLSNQFQGMAWGLIPSWIKTEKDAQEISLKTLNARAESITEKPSFRQVARANRCIIPITGFFEWQLVDKKKIPWFIKIKNDDVFTLAGLWSEWVNPQTGELFKTFTVITTEANELMAKIHNTKKRMPVILARDSEQIWLDKNPSIVKPINSDLLEAYTVSPLVSNSMVNRNVPEVLKPFNYDTSNQGQLF
jgi:putative SOS response-associated peptidase YedK